MAEWSNAPVLKTDVPATVPRVRIPPPPPEQNLESPATRGFFIYYVRTANQTSFFLIRKSLGQNNFKFPALQAEYLLMLCILSSAKTFSSDPCELNVGTATLLPAQTAVLIEKLQTQTPDNLGKLFHVSEKIADLNYGRYQNWDNQEEVPVLHAYNGDAYRALKTEPLTEENWQHANEHIAILSGLYGVLRPTDQIRPHRLEMGTRTKELIGETLYDFWGSQATEKLNEIIKKSGAKYLLNVASKEYYAVIKTSKVSVPIVNIDFKSQTPKGLKTIAIHAKRARGAMARYVLDNQLTELHDLVKFNFAGYSYSEDLSSENNLVFVRE